MQISIINFIIAAGSFLLAGGIAGFAAGVLLQRREMVIKDRQLGMLQNEIKCYNADFKEMRKAVNDQGDKLTEQAQRIKKLKEKAEAVKNENAPDTIDDLLSFFNN